MKTFLKLVTAVMLLAVGLLAFISLSPDYSMYFVRSESMVPALNMGDLVITGPLGGPLTPSLRTGTIVTFKQNKGEVTHRIVSVNNAETITTKGDNAEDADPRPTSLSNISGVYLFKVPYIGFVTSFTRTKLGWYVTIIVPAMGLLGLIIKDIVKEALKES